VELSPEERRLLLALEAGLPRVARPFAALGARAGLEEAEVLRLLEGLLERKVINRLGLILRHHELGFRANAMVVLDLPDAVVDTAGVLLAADPAVTLCYRRPRRPPLWPYNLFCMVHGRDRGVVERRIEALLEAAGLAAAPRAVLFSGRRHKQRGARYGEAAA
jgi:DNA-binding Lrp family transcriptional regulator